MTDLLTPLLRRPTTIDGGSGRSLAVGAALAGLTTSLGVLMGCMALALAGWFASDGGSYGTTRDALRIGADAWLMGHGSRLELATSSITVVPLGLTLLCGYVAFRLGRWAAQTSPVEDLQSVLLGSTVLAGTYGTVAVLTAVLASLEQARPHLALAFLGGFVVAFLGGGAGILAGSGLRHPLRSRLPETAVAIGTGAVAAVLLVLAAAAALVAAALLLDLGTAADVLSRLHADTSGSLLYTVVVASVAPNAVLLGASYLLGSGFAVGTGTVVSPSVVVLGPVPAFPLLAALPDPGATPWWTTLLIALPVLLAAVGAGLMMRRFPVPNYEIGAIRGLGAGVTGGVLVTCLIMLAGGSVGPGRMADIGADLWRTLASAGVAMGIGGLVGAFAMTWWVRRSRRRVEASTTDALAD